jgi:hypothetical protein
MRRTPLTPSRSSGNEVYSVMLAHLKQFTFPKFPKHGRSGLHVIVSVHVRDHNVIPSTWEACHLYSHTCVLARYTGSNDFFVE